MILSRPKESLNSHITKLLRQYKLLSKNKKIDIIIKNIINKLCQENKKLEDLQLIIYNLFIFYLEFHDEGKKNPYFQSYIGNKDYKNYSFTKLNKHHSEISAIYYIIKMYNEYIIDIKSRVKQEYLKDIILSLGYNIYRHHSNLEDVNKDIFISNLIQYYENNKEQFINIDLKYIDYLYRFKSRSHIKYTNPYTYYLFLKLTYSILITCDFMSVYSFNCKKDLNINIINLDKKNLINNTFNKNKIIKNIRKLQINSNLPINKLNRMRTEMFLESEEQLNKNKNSNIFYLEAPTGCGKSLTSLNLAYNLLDNIINKIYYVAPYNNIIEQTHQTIKNSFYNKVVTVNSREEVFLSEENRINYDKDYFNMQLINYPVSLISHIRLFDIIFSHNRFKNLMLSTLCNSVIIIDEIQSYKNQKWIEIINTLKEYSEMLNLKIIIMSATLPKMQKLIEDKDFYIPNLIKNRDYYYNYFKQRVDFDFSLFHKKKNDINEIIQKIDDIIYNTNKHRILIECLTTDRAEEFYKKLKKYKSNDFLIFKMIGITNSINREYIINKIQEKINNEYKNKKIILIGTQCIEAGIDIDMQIGFKDISILDADEQFAGRIERNFKDIGKIYFFDIDDSDFIYKGDYRTEKSLKDKEWQLIFKNKDFNKFYERNYKWLLENNYNTYIEFKSNLLNLQYIKTQESMKLINTKNYSFLFLSQYQNDESAESYLNIFNKIKDSKLTYTEKQIKLIHIKKQLNKYIYNINAYKFKNDILLEQNDNLYLVDNAEQYFDNLTNDNKLKKESNIDISSFIKDIQLFV